MSAHYHHTKRLHVRADYTTDYSQSNIKFNFNLYILLLLFILIINYYRLLNYHYVVRLSIIIHSLMILYRDNLYHAGYIAVPNVTIQKALAPVKCFL